MDIGGTKVFGALVDEGGAILRRVTIPTDRRAGTASVMAALDQLLGSGQDAGQGPLKPPVAVGVAAAALVAYPTGRIASAPNLNYEEPDLAGAVRERFGLPAVVENDANAAAWAEREHGAAAGSDNMIMVTVGTGVGGGAVVGGWLLRGDNGFAAEFGHITVLDGGPLCGCGQRGCLEAFASGTAIGRLAREGLAAADGTDLLERAGGEPGAITGVLVSEAAHAGDAYAAKVLGLAGRWLGVGLASLVNAFDPEIIVVGGGGAAAGWFLLEPARLEMDRRLAVHRPRPPVVVATLGNEAGAIGVASLARIHARLHAGDVARHDPRPAI